MDIDTIKAQFNKVILYSQDMPNVNSDKLFNDWLEAKRDFIEAFGGNLIYEWPETVSFELQPKEKIKKIDNFIKLLIQKYGYGALADFITENKNSFFKNLVESSYDYYDIKIPKGMKLIKAFKFFIPNKDLLNEIQSIASMILQEDKIEGKLCLSVHPLDFISASENNHNWRSCHALDGEFRSGNLSYMTDKCTIMCYLRSNEMEVLPNFPEDVPWNSKKWRVWLYFSKDNWQMMFAGRQYPFEAAASLDFIKDTILPKLNMGKNWSPWLDKKIDFFEDKGVLFRASSPYVPINDELVPMKQLVKDNPNSLQFNDLLSSSSYDPIYSFQVERCHPFDEITSYPKIRAKYAKFELGGAVDCLCCGQNKIELTESMMCNDCELVYGTCSSDIFDICDCCGNRYYSDDGYWLDNYYERLCPDCVDKWTRACDCCGELFYEKDLIFKDDDTILCKYCAEENV